MAPGRTTRYNLMLLLSALLIAAALPASLLHAETGAQAAPPSLFSGDAPLNAALLRSAASPARFSDVAASSFSPDADPPAPAAQNSTRSTNAAGPRLAPIYTKYIPAGWTAQPITARDKVIIGARDLYSPLSLLGDLASAGYSDLVDGQPNYGVNRTALGQRVGATVLRDSTEGIFTDMVFSPLFHEDPRYFVQGPQHSFFHRVIYAVTRPILTRSDSGHTTINAAELVGYAGASVLSYTYYPQINRNFHDTAATFGGGLGGSAIGFVVSEFADQVLQAVHLEKRP